MPRGSVRTPDLMLSLSFAIQLLAWQKIRRKLPSGPVCALSSCGVGGQSAAAAMRQLARCKAGSCWRRRIVTLPFLQQREGYYMQKREGYEASSGQGASVSPDRRSAVHCNVNNEHKSHGANRGFEYSLLSWYWAATPCRPVCASFASLSPEHGSATSE